MHIISHQSNFMFYGRPDGPQFQACSQSTCLWKIRHYTTGVQSGECLMAVINIDQGVARVGVLALTAAPAAAAAACFVDCGDVWRMQAKRGNNVTSEALRVLSRRVDGRQLVPERAAGPAAGPRHPAAMTDRMRRCLAPKRERETVSLYRATGGERIQSTNPWDNIAPCCCCCFRRVYDWLVKCRQCLLSSSAHSLLHLISFHHLVQVYWHLLRFFTVSGVLFRSGVWLLILLIGAGCNKTSCVLIGC